jgi:hypothetical protein
MKAPVILVLCGVLSLVFQGPPLQACTTAIVSGKATVDGRPLLLKHRDADELQNKLMFFKDGKYEYIGLVNSPDSLGKEVWAGCNSAGFAIMNSASYNLNVGDASPLKDREGVVMKQALQSCATVEDFEKFLRRLPKPLGVEANFGVIDAQGGAAYYETGNNGFTKFDANDPAVAPFGYLIRTNYSFTGQRKEDLGLIRYRTAEELFYMASATRALSADFIIEEVSRCLKHSLTKTDLTERVPSGSGGPSFVGFRDYIPRFSSSASVVVQGAARGESPELTTMWTILGFPLCAVAVPVWVKGGAELPEVLMADGSGTAPLCRMAMTLKKRCFPIDRGSGESYLELSALLNREGDGILQRIRPFEASLLKEVGQRIANWREKGVVPEDLRKTYRWLDEAVRTFYKDSFGL